MTPGDIVFIDTAKAPWFGAFARKPFTVKKVATRILIEWYTADKKQHTGAGSNYALVWIDRQYLKGFDDEQTAQDDVTCDVQGKRIML